MKKIIAMVMVVVLAFSMVACGNGESAKIESLDDLAGKKIGVQLGTTGDTYISGDIDDGVYEGASVERYSKGFEAVQALLQGKIDAVIIDNEPAKVFVAQNEDTLKILDTEYTVEDYAMAFAKDNEELQQQFNQAIAELKADGTIDALLDYYINGNEDAKPYESPADIEYDGELVMATNAEFPPYEMHATDADGNDYITGLDADLAKAICDKLGKKLVIEDMAFDSILPAVSGGKADFAAAGLTVTEERQKNVNFSDTYCTGIQVVIVKK